MAFQPPVECPICQQTVALDRTLEDHLKRTHTHEEVIQYVVSHHEHADTHPIS